MSSRPTNRALAAALAVTAAVTLAGCTGTHAVSQDVGGTLGFQLAADPALHFVSPAHRGSPVTGVSGDLLDGSPFDLSAYRGHVVVVNFWESNCAPCRTEAQALNQVYVDNRSKGVEFLGVDLRDNRASAESFQRGRHVQYPSLYDEDGTVGLHFPGYGPNATPTTMVLDRSGRVAARQSGSILYTQLRDVVAHVLAEPA